MIVPRSVLFYLLMVDKLGFLDEKTYLHIAPVPLWI